MLAMQVLSMTVNFFGPQYCKGYVPAVSLLGSAGVTYVTVLDPPSGAFASYACNAVMVMLLDQLQACAEREASSADFLKTQGITWREPQAHAGQTYGTAPLHEGVE